MRAEYYLKLCCKYKPNDPLLSNLEKEMLPKLKNRFGIASLFLEQDKESKMGSQASFSHSLTTTEPSTPSRISAKSSVP